MCVDFSTLCLRIRCSLLLAWGLVTGKCRLNVKSAGGTSQDGVNMASKWDILDMCIEEKGTSFHESWSAG